MLYYHTWRLKIKTYEYSGRPLECVLNFVNILDISFSRCA